MFDGIVSRKCCGLYVGKEAIIMADAYYKKGEWVVDELSYEIAKDTDATSGNAAKSISSNVEKLLERHPPSSGSVQVAFDDSLIRFFVLNLPDAKNDDSDEQLSLIRWHAKKVLGDVSDYEFTMSRVSETQNNMLYGAAINVEILNSLESVFMSRNLLWTVADSVASFRWNSLDANWKSRGAAFVTLGSAGWTLMIWGRSGTLMLIKPGRWRSHTHSDETLEKGFIEIRRLISTYVGQNPTQAPDRIYIDSGCWEIPDSLASQVFGNAEVIVRSLGYNTVKLDDTLSPYIQEAMSSIQAAVPR